MHIGCAFDNLCHSLPQMCINAQIHNLQILKTVHSTLFTLDVHSIRKCLSKETVCIQQCRIQTLFTLQVHSIRNCSHCIVHIVLFTLYCATWKSAGCRWCRHRSKIIDHQLGAGNHQTKASLHLRWGNSEFSSGNQSFGVKIS